MPSHDITFCEPSNCPKAENCRRAHPPKDVDRLAFSPFYVAGGDCEYYWPTSRNIKEEK